MQSAMPATYFQVDPNLFLVRQPVNTTAAASKPVDQPAHHVLVLDVSGSMSGELPSIRRQLKDRARDLIRDSDTLSIIWFSGRGECGTLFEGEPIATLADLSRVNAAIDRWLRPVGMTGFREPLEEVAALVARVAKARPDSVHSLWFMSDGCDNSWRREEILSAATKAAGGLASAVVVEYGWYADRPMLTAIAERMGGTVIHAKDFDTYQPMFADAMSKRHTSGAKRIEVKVGTNAVGGFAFALHDGELLTFTIDDGKVLVPDGVADVWRMSTVGPKAGDHRVSLLHVMPVAGSQSVAMFPEVVDAAYAALSLFAARMQSDTVLALLSRIGDVRLIDMFARCFGKQAYSAFTETAKQAAFGKGRFTYGRDVGHVPRADAFTVLDLLTLLSQDDGCRVVLDHPSWKYNAISRARVDTSALLKEDDVTAVAALVEALKDDRSTDKAEAVRKALEAALAGTDKPLKFVPEPAPQGYPVTGLAFNSERANVSLRITQRGTVDLTQRIGKQDATTVSAIQGVHNVFPTSRVRQYAIIADGIVNVDYLPVIVSPAVWAKLNAEGIVPGPHSSNVLAINITRMPVINRKMVADVSAKTIFENAFAVERVAALTKVYRHFLKTHFPKAERSELAVTYGAQAATWLKDQGITDNGFAPASTQVESTDKYVAREMSIAIPGLSSLPKVEDARAKMDSPKATLAVRLMAPAIREVDAWLKKEGLDLAAVKPADCHRLAAFESYLEAEVGKLETEKAAAVKELTEAVFVVIVGQKWPSEWPDMGDVAADQAKEATKKAAGQDVKRRIAARGSLPMMLDGPKPLDCELRLYEVDVAI